MKPTPVELTPRDMKENRFQAEQCAQYPYATFEGGDPIAQDVFIYVVRVQRDHFPEAPSDPRPRRGGRDSQFKEQVGIPTAYYLLLEYTVITGAATVCREHDERRAASAGRQVQAVDRQEAL